MEVPICLGRVSSSVPAMLMLFHGVLYTTAALSVMLVPQLWEAILSGMSNQKVSIAERQMFQALGIVILAVGVFHLGIGMDVLTERLFRRIVGGLDIPDASSEQRSSLDRMSRTSESVLANEHADAYLSGRSQKQTITQSRQTQSAMLSGVLEDFGVRVEELHVRSAFYYSSYHFAFVVNLYRLTVLPIILFIASVVLNRPLVRLLCVTFLIVDLIVGVSTMVVLRNSSAVHHTYDRSNKKTNDFSYRSM